MKNTKEYILKESLALFLKKSYKDVTMNDLMKQTSLSKGAFYHYFQNKEALFKEIVNLTFSFGQVDYDNFPSDSLKSFYLNYIDMIGQSFEKMFELAGTGEGKADSLNMFFIVFEAIKRFPEFLTLENEMYEREVAFWEKCIGNARRMGEIVSSSSDRDIADLFLYCTDGVFIRYLNNKNIASYRDSLKKAFDTLYENLRSV